MGWPRPVLVLAGRTGLGLLLGAVLSVIGIGLGWGMYVFFGAVSHAALMTVFMAGAGLGAGFGGFAAWLRVDRHPPWPVQLGLGLILVLAGIVGAWGGFQFGANQEVECCVGPAITPITYTAMGASVGANAAALVLGVVQEINIRRVRAKFRPAIARSNIGASNDGRRLRR